MTRDSIRLVTTVGGISEPLPTMTARMEPPREGPRDSSRLRPDPGRDYGGGPMLRRGEVAPDFAVGGRTLYQILDEQSAVVFFYPKAFTPG